MRYNITLARSTGYTERRLIVAWTLVNFSARHHHGITRAEPARVHTCHLDGGLSSIRSEFSFFFHLAFELPGSMVEPNSKLSAYSAYSPGISARSLVEWR